MQAEKADLVILNGKVVTVDRDFSFQEALAVKNGWIINVGRNHKIKEHIGKGSRVIDLQGKIILPGTHDGHIHATHMGFFLDPKAINLNYPAVKSIGDINKKLREATKRMKPGEWIVGLGWDSTRLAECANEHFRTPNRWDFDAVTPDHPIALFDYSAHAVVVNSKALEIAGITRETADLKPEYGYFDRDPRTGEPNGHFCEWGAMRFIGRHMPRLSDEEIEKCIKRIQKHLNENGVTSHADILGIGGDHLFFGTWGRRVIEIYEKMFREGKLTARVSINIMAGLEGVQGYDAIVGGLKQTSLPDFRDRNWVKADIIKIFGDGAPVPEGGYGSFYGATREEQREGLINSIIEAHRRGWQVAVHATMEMALDAAIEAFIKAQQMYPRESPRHFIIHGDWFTREKAAEAFKYKIGLAAQPNVGFHLMDILVKLFGRNRASRLFAHRDLMEAGINVAGGSDALCIKPNWRLGAQFAVTRKTVHDNVYAPELAGNIEDAIRMYTINGAYQEHMENIRGSIEVNKVADFQVLGDDIFNIEKEKISEIPVVMTICDGQVVYEA